MRDRIESVRPFPGIGGAVGGLRQTGARCAILSSNSRANVLCFLKYNAIDKFEPIHAGASLFSKAKRLRGLLEAVNPVPGSSHIGDEARDVMAAKEAGMRSVAVTWDYIDRSVLAAERTDVLVDTPEQLRTLPSGTAIRFFNMD